MALSDRMCPVLLNYVCLPFIYLFTSIVSKSFSVSFCVPFVLINLAYSIVVNLAPNAGIKPLLCCVPKLVHYVQCRMQCRSAWQAAMVVLLVGAESRRQGRRPHLKLLTHFRLNFHYASHDIMSLWHQTCFVLH